MNVWGYWVTFTQGFGPSRDTRSVSRNDGSTGRAATKRAMEMSERKWLGVRDDFRDWLIRAA